MSGVIKQHDPRASTDIRAVRRGMSDVPRTIDPLTARLALAEGEITRLMEALARQEAETAQSRSAVRDAFEEGRQSGLEEGRTIGEARAAAALERLGGALTAAAGGLDAALGALEHLAPLIAKAALGKLVGSPGERLGLVTDAVRLQLDKLERATIVQAEVSSEDFPDRGSVEGLPQTLGAPRLKVVVREDLVAGEACLRLTLGEIEVGPAQQWRHLAAVLDALAAGDAP